MSVDRSCVEKKQFAGDAGIAIGPILFIIAILGILAAAIAAGSGSFTAGTGTESNSTKASALIQIGENLKVGFERMTMEQSLAFNAVVISANATNAAVDLFSPTGGGVTAPSTTLSNVPGTDIWYYPTAIVPNLGSGANDMLAVLKVASGVCDQVNAKANALAATPTGADIGDPTSGDLGAHASNWPAALKGLPIGCINNTDAASGAGGFWFYEVMGIQ